MFVSSVLELLLASIPFGTLHETTDPPLLPPVTILSLLEAQEPLLWDTNQNASEGEMYSDLLPAGSAEKRGESYQALPILCQGSALDLSSSRR